MDVQVGKAVLTGKCDQINCIAGIASAGFAGSVNQALAYVGGQSMMISGFPTIHAESASMAKRPQTDRLW